MALTRAFYGITIALADTNAHNLYTLLAAVESDLAGLVQNVSMLRIQSADSSGANLTYIGDVNVATTRIGRSLLKNESAHWVSQFNMNIPVRDMYVLASGATCTLYCELIIN